MFKIINLKRLKKDLNNYNKINIKIFKEIINNNHKKIIIIFGPCSLSNIKDFFFYIKKIKKMNFNLNFIIRVYYEKPRSNIGWKGFVYDPYLDNSYCIIDGIYMIRKLLIDLIKKKLFLATECLNFYFLNFFIDCISWVCIGARTMNSQLHREFCSNIKNIIGIKNDVSSDLKLLNDFKISLINKHCFLSFNNFKIIFSKGNKNYQFVLRGGNKPNYNFTNIKNINSSIVVDCSHSNSFKIPINQIFVFENVYNQFKYYKNKINGLMFETYEKFGCQSIINKFKFVSVTDSCLNFSLLNLILNKINAN
ncbi:3-deoxy-7-phosphoheptulonate synthase [Candidatus Carsonella ruddii]|uniref:3-deoxy-7-phosphoheptulonate synthase n=2 Tax=cellular organisms TaxID=131567 RepID=A0AAJ6FDL3_CARRU|nr:3-deoxy-7-phosphoheptulonate synthase [Candidatus Carsonella ruddii]WGS66785.1 3-deoxy-7-phosphoheptulonate synthase [Candidatus Carsonella ruddii]WGS66976.1 3-deoxy-7-phosphoheptulonate synthase [Candidatus Carsonella ruddii]WGS67167.1 3-deoxy-7-phosphoheptulonate synthase [Candidatus Carsonella ruddii]WMC18183.1 MAG: 3-deoxy-7-phosphoheptulonate synthase [Candidatus Carsonella ruddii]WMC18377.1 MAG: 3-deoxy-7-phosphoheptulonate synthase [Candidatus Carsonella ruddii]